MTGNIVYDFGKFLEHLNFSVINVYHTGILPVQVGVAIELSALVFIPTTLILLGLPNSVAKFLILPCNIDPTLTEERKHLGQGTEMFLRWCLSRMSI